MAWSRRYEEFFLGDQTFEFCISTFVVLEQPRDSVLPKRTSLNLVSIFLVLEEF